MVELDDLGEPIAADPAAVHLIDRIEGAWPHVDAVLAQDVLALGGEALPLRYWLVERLAVEGDPPATVFAILPWDLLDRGVDAVLGALGPPGAIGELVEIRHWLAPAVPGLTGPLKQLDHGLRTADPALVQVAAVAVLHRLESIVPTRVPIDSRRKLTQLAARLGEINVGLRHLADVAEARLTGDGPLLVPAWFDARVVSVGYMGSEPDIRPGRATLEFADSASAVLGREVRATLTRTATSLIVTLSQVGPDAPTLTVDAGDPNGPSAVLARRGRALVAELPWSQADLPSRLVFRIAG